MKLFEKYDMEDVEVTDPGLVDYINLDPVLIPRISHGRHASDRLDKGDVNVIERLTNRLFGPGHRGGRHKISSGRCGGDSSSAIKILKETLEIIEDELDTNPVEVVAKAIENSALREEVSSYQVGSIIRRKAVVTSPQRRVDLALRHLTQGAYSDAVGSEKNMARCLADEIMAAYNEKRDSYAIRQKERLEREAAGAR